MKIQGFFAGAAAIALMTSGAVEAQSLRIATGQPETHAHSYGLQNFATYLQENSDIEPTIFLMELLNLSEIPDGLRDGIAEVGNVVTAYAPASYAETNLIADLSMNVTAGEAPPIPAAAMSGAVMEYILLNCPDCVAEYTAQNQVFLASASTSPYVLLCRDPVTTLDGLKGLKLRSGAANFGRWAESVGGVKVSLPGNEIYEAMSQGVVDCAMLAVTTLIETSLIDVTGAVLKGVPGGVFAGLADNAVNLDVWRDLDPETREVFLRGSAELAADIVFKQTETEAEAYAMAEERGLEIDDASPEILANYDQFVADDTAVIADTFGSQYGIEDVDAKIETATGLIDKWKELTRDVETREALAELYWTEVLSKVDTSTYPEG